MHPWHNTYIDDTTIASAFPVIIAIPKGRNQQVRDGQGDRAITSGSGAVERGVLPGGLWLHSTNLLRRRRPARRARARQ